MELRLLRKIECMGRTTISTPHYNSTQSLADITRDGLFKFMHLLRLMGSIGDADLSSIDPSVLPLSDVLGAEGLPNLTEEYLRQLATLVFNEDVTTIFSRDGQCLMTE